MLKYEKGEIICPVNNADIANVNVEIKMNNLSGYILMTLFCLSFWISAWWIVVKIIGGF